MNWRLIEQSIYNAAMNMAIEHAIYESVANERELPTIRFYKWENNSVSLGAYQNPKDINLDACKKYNVELVRRMTGGRAVFHDKVDFTYSVIAPIRVFKHSIRNAYQEICSSIINTLKDLGISSALENKNNIIVNEKKISGNAAKAMPKGVYLQHGTLIYDIDLDIMPKILNVTPDLIKERVTSILQHKRISQEKVYNILKKKFIANKKIKISSVSKFELMRAEELAKSKYNSTIVPINTVLKNKGACYVER